MSTNLLNCIDTIWFPGRDRRKARAIETAATAMEPVPAPAPCAAPAMLMTSRDIGPLVVRVAERLAEWQRRRAGRRELMRLSERDLKDIGLDRAAAEEEYRKPFWR